MKINVGTLVNFHGVRGEVKVLSDSEFVNERFSPKQVVTIHNETYTITNYRKHKNFHLLTFQGINNVNEVEHLKGKEVFQEFDAIDFQLPEGVYHYLDIIGCTVINKENNKILGEVTDILPTGSKDVLVIGDYEYMIPHVEDFIESIDISNKEIVITPIEGLLDT